VEPCLASPTPTNSWLMRGDQYTQIADPGMPTFFTSCAGGSSVHEAMRVSCELDGGVTVLGKHGNDAQFGDSLSLDLSRKGSGRFRSRNVSESGSNQPSLGRTVIFSLNSFPCRQPNAKRQREHELSGRRWEAALDAEPSCCAACERQEVLDTTRGLS
jgi:hypothetical protein